MATIREFYMKSRYAPQITVEASQASVIRNAALAFVKAKTEHNLQALSAAVQKATSGKIEVSDAENARFDAWCSEREAHTRHQAAEWKRKNPEGPPMACEFDIPGLESESDPKPAPKKKAASKKSEADES